MGVDEGKAEDVVVIGNHVKKWRLLRVPEIQSGCSNFCSRRLEPMELIRIKNWMKTWKSKNRTTSAGIRVEVVAIRDLAVDHSEIVRDRTSIEVEEEATEIVKDRTTIEVEEEATEIVMDRTAVAEEVATGIAKDHLAVEVEEEDTEIEKDRIAVEEEEDTEIEKDRTAEEEEEDTEIGKDRTAVEEEEDTEIEKDRIAAEEEEDTEIVMDRTVEVDPTAIGDEANVEDRIGIAAEIEIITAVLPTTLSIL